MGRQTFRLASNLVSRDTISALETLAHEARDHILVGSILIPLYKGKRYFPITTGWAADNLTFTTGVLDVCKLLITEKALAQSVLDSKF